MLCNVERVLPPHLKLILATNHYTRRGFGWVQRSGDRRDEYRSTKHRRHVDQQTAGFQRRYDHVLPQVGKAAIPDSSRVNHADNSVWQGSDTYTARAAVEYDRSCTGDKPAVLPAASYQPALFDKARIVSGSDMVLNARLHSFGVKLQIVTTSEESEHPINR